MSDYQKDKVNYTGTPSGPKPLR